MKCLFHFFQGIKRLVPRIMSYFLKATKSKTKNVDFKETTDK